MNDARMLPARNSLRNFQIFSSLSKFECKIHRFIKDGLGV